jgi:hypothetical protein
VHQPDRLLASKRRAVLNLARTIHKGRKPMNRLKTFTSFAFVGVCVFAASQGVRAGTVEMSFSYQSLLNCTQTLDAEDVDGVRGKSCVRQADITTPGSISVIFDDTPDSDNTGYADYYIYHDENRKRSVFQVSTDFAAPMTFDHAFKNAFLEENPHYDQLTAADDPEVNNFDEVYGGESRGDVDGTSYLSISEDPTGSAPSRSAFVSTDIDGAGEYSALYNETYALTDGTPVADVAALAVGDKYVQTLDYYGEYRASTELYASIGMDFEDRDDLYKMTVDDLIYILITDSFVSFSTNWYDYDYTRSTTYQIYEQDGQRRTKYIEGFADYDSAAGQSVSGSVSFDSITVYDDADSVLYTGTPQTYLDNRGYVSLDERSDPNHIDWVEETHHIYDAPAEVVEPPLITLLALGLVGLLSVRRRLGPSRSGELADQFDQFRGQFT